MSLDRDQLREALAYFEDTNGIPEDVVYVAHMLTLMRAAREQLQEAEWFCRSLFGLKCSPVENDGRDHDQCGVEGAT